jgi:hypothetical protein
VLSLDPWRPDAVLCAITEDEAKGGVTMRQFEYRVLDTGRDIESQLNELGAEGWQVVGVTTKKQLFIAPPQAIILMRELQPAVAKAA